MKKHNSKGFTLIELMIVVAIIGIIAALALPAYQIYIARSQASEALIVTEGLKNDIGIYYWEKGIFPPAGSNEINSASELGGKYFDIGDANLAPSTGVITVNFTKGANAGKNITITPKPALGSNNQIITWVCSGSIDAARLPATCQ